MEDPLALLEGATIAQDKEEDSSTPNDEEESVPSSNVPAENDSTVDESSEPSDTATISKSVKLWAAILFNAPGSVSAAL